MLSRGEKTFGEDRAVVGELVAAGLRELLKKIGHGQLLLLLARNVEDDVAVVQHDEAVAVLNGIAHVVRDHQRGELALAHDAVGELHDLGGGLRVECRGVLIEQQQLGALERCHQQRERLALAAGERRDLRGQAGLKAEAETAEQLAVLLLFLLRHAPGKTAALAAAGGEGEVLFDPHRGGGAHHRVLEHAADECRALVLGQVRDVGAVDDDLAGVDKERAGGGVEHRGLARAVAADDGDEVAVVQRQTQAVQRGLGVDGAGVEGLIKFLEFKHGHCLRSLRSGAAPCGGTSCSSSRGWRGRPPRSAP